MGVFWGSRRSHFMGVFGAHTDLTDPTLSLWVGNLTDALRWFSPKAHIDSARFKEKIICGNLCEFVSEKAPI